MKKRWYALIFFISIIIAFVHGVFLVKSPNIFLSWIFIGLWICFSVSFVQRLKYSHEVNSPHNTAFFVVGPLFIGLLFSCWGYFTGLLEWNFFAEGLYLSPWILIFAFPYLGYGAISLYSCFKRYDIIYLGQKSVSARKFGILITFLTVIGGFFYILFAYIILSASSMPLYLRYPYPDLLLLLISIFSLFLIIRYGFFGRKPTITQISAAATSRPVSRREVRPMTPSPSRPQTTISATVRPSATRSAPQRPASSPAPRSASRSTPSVTGSQKSTSKSKETAKATKTEPRVNIKLYRPKGGALSLEDFKCIFCFKLPELPADKERGIILCPMCKRPAHTDEFKDWMTNSNLCSRCGATIPSKFRQNPEIISVKRYVEVIRIYSKK